MPEAPESPDHVAIFRKDYRPPDHWVSHVDLDVALDPDSTRVTGRLKVQRNGDHDRPLRLAGDELRPLSVKVDGEDAEWTMDGDDLVIALAAADAEIETQVEIAPAANSKLMGLYASGGLLCTQCESEGFRRITFHPDRPDVLSVYSVRLSADKARFPILLANGNEVDKGDNGDGTHWARWDDPFPKPSYLFAMVAGDLAANRDQFTTMSGRKVDLAIWVREADLPKTAHAMTSLKQSMKWDEEVYGREYDLDLFNIVAVSDFNFGAMENKGLNIFNSAYVLADTDTATDGNFDAIAGIVAHEYFHNWSGNRVTCRDWFQLSLKEGFTVFRDQSFSADIGSAAVKRIEDVRILRAAQFPEDSGPLAHPVRPDSYIEITNFYTATVYNKGAEVIRMMKTILGEEAFRKGSDLYFDRHDGEAATCDDFVAAMEEASGQDLSQFKNWYSTAGTPYVTARLDHDAGAGRATLHLTQRVPDTPGQSDKPALVIPLRTALIGRDSGEMLGEEQLILLSEKEQSVAFEGVTEAPLLSINRGFSAPINLAVERGEGELEKLAAADPDPFARFEANQELMMRALLAGARGETMDLAPVLTAMQATLRSNALDPAFKAEALAPPGENIIAERLEKADPMMIHAARETLRKAAGEALADDLRAAQAVKAAGDDLSSEAKGIRKLRAVAMALLSAGHPDEATKIAAAQYMSADNMTDRLSALGVLAHLGGADYDKALAAFYDRYRGDDLVIDKWFAIQSTSGRPGALDRIADLMTHGDFTMKNPNRLRSVAAFAYTPCIFHSGDGQGYQMLGDLILAADKLNPQVAARMVPALGRWRKLAEPYSTKMREELERLAADKGLSKDVFEQVTKSLV